MSMITVYYHTTEDIKDAITESKVINSTSGRFGNGVYFTSSLGDKTAYPQNDDGKSE